MGVCHLLDSQYEDSASKYKHQIYITHVQERAFVTLVREYLWMVRIQTVLHTSEAAPAGGHASAIVLSCAVFLSRQEGKFPESAAIFVHDRGG